MRALLLTLFAAATFACGSNDSPSTSTAPAAAPPKEMPAEADEWIVLFDGTSTDGWRGYNAKTMPPGWVIEDGVLTFDDGAKTSDAEYEGGKDIIYAAEKFDNFELEIEWKIPPGGNSGIFYHVAEGYDAPSQVAPEYQLIDDEHYTDFHDITNYNKSLGYGPELQDWQSTAADYAMYTGDQAGKQLNPAGEWNHTRIKFTPERAEYWLNGKLVVDFIPWSEDWNKRKNGVKFANAPDYGKFKTGYIGLQDHDSALWFRNIKIKRL